MSNARNPIQKAPSLFYILDPTSWINGQQNRFSTEPCKERRKGVPAWCFLGPSIFLLHANQTTFDNSTTFSGPTQLQWALTIGVSLKACSILRSTTFSKTLKQSSNRHLSRLQNVHARVLAMYKSSVGSMYPFCVIVREQRPTAQNSSVSTYSNSDALTHANMHILCIYKKDA